MRALAVILERELGGVEVWGEPRLRAAEQEAGHAIASALLGTLPDGRPRLRRPDLVLFPPDTAPVAVEVELSVKAGRRPPAGGDLPRLGPLPPRQRGPLLRAAVRGACGFPRRFRSPMRATGPGLFIENTGLYERFLRGLAGCVEFSKTRGDSQAIAREEAQDWASTHRRAREAGFDRLASAKQYETWPEWNIGHGWIEHYWRLGGVVDEVFVRPIAAVLEVSELDLQQHPDHRHQRIEDRPRRRTLIPRRHIGVRQSLDRPPVDPHLTLCEASDRIADDP